MCLAENEEKTAKIKNPAGKTRRIQKALAHITRLAHITQKDIFATGEEGLCR
jgi:hypothetical protein